MGTAGLCWELAASGRLPLINMLSNQEADLTQQALDTSQQLPLASAPSWTLNLRKPISDTDWFSRYISTLKTRTKMVLETLVFSPLNQLTQLAVCEYFIIQCHHESYKSYMMVFSYTFLAPTVHLCLWFLHFKWSDNLVDNNYSYLKDPEPLYSTLSVFQAYTVSDETPL
jgi:hypothetical protein